MTKVEVSDFETIEVTEERYKCDSCNAIVQEDEITTVLYLDGEPSQTARVLDNSVESKHHCEDCTGLKRALRIREQKNRIQTRWFGLKKSVVKSVNLVSPVLFTCLGGLAMFFAGVMQNNEGETSYILLEPFLGLILAGLLLVLGSFAANWVIGSWLD